MSPQGLLGRLLGGGRGAEPPPGPLADLVAADPPDARTPISEVELLAIDLETTGLDPRADEILSVGFVPVRGTRIDLATARELVVRPQGQVGQSATFHGLTDDALAGAPPLADVVPEVLRALRTDDEPPTRRVLLAHFAQIESDFLRRACRQLYGADLPLLVVDTLALEAQLLRSRPDQVEGGRLRLDACRRAHRLPRYRAHSAGVDALACAELFLAQSAALEDRTGRPLTLRDLLAR